MVDRFVSFRPSFYSPSIKPSPDLPQTAKRRTSTFLSNSLFPGMIFHSPGPEHTNIPAIVSHCNTYIKLINSGLRLLTYTQRSEIPVQIRSID